MTTYKSKLNSIRRFIFFCVLISIFVCIFGPQIGNAQKDVVVPWLFNTHDKTNFPLTGRHRAVPCKECHWNNVFEGTPSSCNACHWVRRNDDRYQLKLGNHCEECHTTFSWKNVPYQKWNHERDAGYGLRGSHRFLDCVQCHGERGFFYEEVSCFSCHEEELESCQNPDHIAAGFSTQCWVCHINEISWENALFSHDFFPLKDKHRLLLCSECHRGSIYKGLASSCFSCHLQDYENTKDPDHMNLGYPLECEVCHGISANTWENALFTHNNYPLKGNHRAAACSECHGSGIYEGLPSVCVFCHLDDWLYAENPNHKQLDFHQDCEVCHGDDAISWTNSAYTHISAWPLQGAHTRLECIECHNKGRNIPKDCVSCHISDYNATSSPEHSALGFPLNCEQCHMPSHKTWNQALFDHRFPIKSGRHAQLDCTDCHQSSNLRDFSCLNCHDHEKMQMDRKHRIVSGYVYQSQSCLACHFHGKR